MAKRYSLRKLPACQDYKGNQYPARFGLTLHGPGGFRWDGGEYATRDEALAAGERSAA